MAHHQSSTTLDDPSASKILLSSNNKEKTAALEGVVSVPETEVAKGSSSSVMVGEDSGRERLKRHRIEVAGRVWIPEIWGQEDLLKDWIDCTAFDANLVPSRITTARAALVQEGRSTRPNNAAAGVLRIENRC